MKNLILLIITHLSFSHAGEFLKLDNALDISNYTDGKQPRQWIVTDNIGLYAPYAYDRWQLHVRRQGDITKNKSYFNPKYKTGLDLSNKPDIGYWQSGPNEIDTIQTTFQISGTEVGSYINTMNSISTNDGYNRGTSWQYVWSTKPKPFEGSSNRELIVQTNFILMKAMQQR